MKQMMFNKMELNKLPSDDLIIICKFLITLRVIADLEKNIEELKIEFKDLQENLQKIKDELSHVSLSKIIISLDPYNNITIK